VGTTSFGFVRLAAAVSTIATVFFLGFAAAGLGAAAGLVWGFLGLAVFLVAVTLGCFSASVPGLGEGFGGGLA
jgi:hypothetical protein